MFKKCKKSVIFCVFIMLINVVIIGNLILHNYNDLDKTIFVEFSKNYMNANDAVKTPGDGNDEVEYIELYKNNNMYNEKFDVTNMLPGDSETKYYCVNVSYKDAITLKYSVNVKSDYKKIEDVLNFKIKLVNTDEILYDGLIKDISETVDYSTSSSESVSEDFCYEITAYIDTNVGNEYQNTEAIIDFKWVVDEENLENESNPSTGDNVVFWFGLAGVSSILLLLILLALKNERKRLR